MPVTQPPASGGGGGSVAADTIWDTKGDLAVATAADTAAKLVVGSNNSVLTADSSQTTGLKWAAAAVASDLGADVPRYQGFNYWSVPPAPISQVAPTKGVLNVMKIWMPVTVAISNLYCYVGTAGVTLSTCFAGIYDSTGALVTGSDTADQSTPWQSTGLKTMACSSGPVTLTGGSSVFFWMGLLVGNGSTTSPQFLRRSYFDSTQVNANLTAANYNLGQTGTTLTALPGSFTPSGLTNGGSGVFWVAV